MQKLKPQQRTRFYSVIVDKLALEEEQVTPDAKFDEDLGADSLDMVDIILTMETEFDCTLPDSETDSIEKVSDLMELIEKQL